MCATCCVAGCEWVPWQGTVQGTLSHGSPIGHEKAAACVPVDVGWLQFIVIICDWSESSRNANPSFQLSTRHASDFRFLHIRKFRQMLAAEVSESGWMYKVCDPDAHSSFQDCNVRPNQTLSRFSSC